MSVHCHHYNHVSRKCIGSFCSETERLEGFGSNSGRRKVRVWVGGEGGGKREVGTGRESGCVGVVVVGDGGYK